MTEDTTHFSEDVEKEGWKEVRVFSLLPSLQHMRGEGLCRVL